MERQIQINLFERRHDANKKKQNKKNAQGAQAGFIVRLSFFALCWTHTSITNLTGTDLRGYLHQGFSTNQAGSEMFGKLCSVDALK